MAPKDDPLQQSSASPRTLWLDRENNEQARDNYWRVFAESHLPPLPEGVDYVHPRYVWDIAWAASVAAFSFIMEGRTAP